MQVISRKSEVLINGIKTKIEDVVATLKYLPSGEIVTFFENLQITMPRRVRMSALHAVLDDKVTDEENIKKFTDEVNYRLKWFHTYSEHQLEGMLVLLSNVNFENQYREELWLTFLKLHEEIKIDINALSDLFEIAKGYKNSPRESLTEYQRGIDKLFFDIDGEVDGLQYADFREVLKNSSTLTELREIGAKYEIDVPRRIKKNELADIILDEMTLAGTLTSDVEERVKRMSVMSLQRFAKDNKIKASIELKKEDIIEYIIGRVETEVEKSNISLEVLEETPVETPEVVVAAPVVVPEEDGELKQEITDLKGQIAMLVKMQQEMLEKQNAENQAQVVKEENPEIVAELERIRIEKESLEDQLEAERLEKERSAHEREEAERLAKEQALHEALEKERIEKEQLASQLEAERLERERLAKEKEEAELLAKEQAYQEALEKERQEKERLASQLEAERLEKERLAQESLEKERLAKEKEEALSQQLDNYSESASVSDDFIVPIFDDEPIAVEPAPVAEPIVEDTTEASFDDLMSLDEVMAEEKPSETQSDSVSMEYKDFEPSYEDLGLSYSFEEEEPVVQTQEEKDESDIDSLMFMDMDEPVEAPKVVEEKTEEPETISSFYDDMPVVVEDEFETPAFDPNAFEAPVYEAKDEGVSADFDSPNFETPIFEAPVFEAPVYGDQRKSSVNRRLTLETKADKKRRQAEEKALQEALKADAKFTKRRKKRSLIFKFIKWLFILLILLVIGIIVLGFLGAANVVTDGFFFDVYETIRDGLADFVEDLTGFDLREVYRSIKDLFGIGK